MIPPSVILALCAVVALLASGGLGYHFGNTAGKVVIAKLEATISAGADRATDAEKRAGEAEARGQLLAAQLAYQPPEVVYLEKEVIRYVPSKPLPAGACADARWAGMLNSLSGAQPTADPSPGRIPGADSAAAADAGGYVSAQAFRSWAGSAAGQYRALTRRYRALCEFTTSLPGVEKPSGGCP